VEVVAEEGVLGRNVDFSRAMEPVDATDDVLARELYTGRPVTDLRPDASEGGIWSSVVARCWAGLFARKASDRARMASASCSAITLVGSGVFAVDRTRPGVGIPLTARGPPGVGMPL
jgi:hypothetical protein